MGYGGDQKMKSQMMSLNQIRKVGIESLSQTLGPVGMVRFLQQFDTGSGDYTTERERWLGETTLNDIVRDIEEGRRGKQ